MRTKIKTVVNLKGKGFIQEQTILNSSSVPLYILFNVKGDFVYSSIFFNELQAILVKVV